MYALNREQAEYHIRYANKDVIMVVEFYKKDGSLRKMYCHTLKEPTTLSLKDRYIKVFDDEKQTFKKINLDRLTSLTKCDKYYKIKD